MQLSKTIMKESLTAAIGAFVAAAVSAKTISGGLVQEFKYDAPDRAPIHFGGWSRASEAHGHDYCVFADITYADGSALWAQKADFTRGTHDWEYSANALVPQKPVAKIKLYAFLRDGSGKAEFRDVFLKREAPPKDTVLSVRRFTNRPFSRDDVLCERFWDGRWASHRERLAPDVQVNVPNPLAAGEVAVWIADSARRVTPLTFPSAEDRKAVAELEVARRERESFQVIVSTGDDAQVDGATLELESPKDGLGRELKGSVAWERQGYLARRHPYKPHPLEAPVYEKWLPEPLLPAAPFAVRKGGSQGTWITVFADSAALPGLYLGRVKVLAQGGKLLASLPFSVRVRDFALPATFGLKTSFSYMDGFTKPLYPKVWNARRREAHDILLDHRLNPDDITRTDLTRIEDIAHMKARGANSWNLTQIAPPPRNPRAKWLCRPEAKDVFNPGFYEAFTNRLAPHVAALKARGLFDGAYIYGFDECEEAFYPGMRKMYLQLKRDFPDLPIMTTARMFNDFSAGRLKITDDLIAADWFCGSMRRYGIEAADAVRARGCRAWWYTSLEPTHPYMNFANWEYPFIEGRLVLGCCTWLYRTDGFLFWHSNAWREGRGAKLDEMGDTFFPDFNTYGTKGCPGDGVFLYPGSSHILPGIRLANIRDGEEDWECLHLAERKAGRRRIEELVREICRSRKDFSRSLADLRKMRRGLAEIIESAK